ncbi:hypothetical protein M2132_000355 [Dysgonomonas sp. PH5-45]|uniref:DUF5686 and carboxypeptidase-like regulatory domain-containing protein n=1 Tax=unclassified Dysgonomonas TaxID=2630389 RepID=UPI00247721A0|nr:MULTISPECIES: DUF5686 and carboxypeptidase-like regulatory domain-containing protein [unclassified Dysgonomonas]MDH6354035.1 hypothetical protein [Dysgonomonas sp. PH5-45]MDH6386937.1 hypothetical protein [Dysgonomonas sp. PH5-37]
MHTNIITNIIIRFAIFLVFIFAVQISVSAQTTTVNGVVRDAVSGDPVEFATVRFDDSTIGGNTDEKGKFKFSNRNQKNRVIVSYMGYVSDTITVPIGKNTNLDIRLKPEGIKLDEVIIRPKKEKYSKKNNPAVELIKKVIEHKHEHLATAQNNYQVEEFDRVFIALNEFDETKAEKKNMQFLAKYGDTSRIDNKPILPLSLRETLSSFYYRKSPKDTKRIVKAHKTEGLDQGMNLESIDAVLKEVIKDVDITDNSINILFRDFVGPLSSVASVNFYKWYIIDTVSIDQRQYVNLGFVPFNTRDVGFMGNLYVSTDSAYAIKRLSMRVPTNANLNFVEAMLIEQEFEETKPGVWIPKQYIMAMDLSLVDVAKFYVEKVKDFNDFEFNQPMDAVFINPNPVLYLSGYDKMSKEYWDASRPTTFNKDYEVGEMMEELMKKRFFKIAVGAANILSSSYIPTSKDEEKNKFDIGTVLTFFSYNDIEGARFRLTGTTTSHFHPHLFLYGYGAYGIKDQKFKYMGEVNWAFNKPKYHKDEFPVNNLSATVKYDLNALGQRFLQAERDNIFMSGKSGKYDRMTYDFSTQIAYKREYHSGFSYNLFARTHDEKPVKNLVFKQIDEYGNSHIWDRLKTTEVGLDLRYAYKEKFFQQRRIRRTLSTSGFIYNLSYLASLKDVMGGDFAYHRLNFSMTKEFWIAPFGKVYTNVTAEKLFGEAPFTALVSPNANTSYTVQKGSFYLLNPMEFVSDAQVTWDINYRMGGWLLNRIPLIKHFGWREIFGFRGVWGSLSKKNNPDHNRKLLAFPEEVYTIDKKPYMEINIGLENILKIFRIDYVRRLNYLDHPNIDKHGIRISLDVAF